MKTISVTLSEDELNMLTYSMKEYADRMREKAIDLHRPAWREDAERIDATRRKVTTAWEIQPALEP